MTADRYLLAIDDRGVATLTLNRPEVANAYDEDLLRALTAALQIWRTMPRCVRWSSAAPASTSRRAPTSTG